MWSIFEKKSAVKQIHSLPKDVVIKYEAWKRIVELEGPQGLRKIEGFHDEVLSGDWKGFRSSRLGIKWRVIYCIKDGALEVYVFEVNAHKY